MGSNRLSDVASDGEAKGVLGSDVVSRAAADGLGRRRFPVRIFEGADSTDVRRGLASTG